MVQYDTPMKDFVILVAFLVVSLFAAAQDPQKTTTGSPASPNENLAVYHNAVSLQDYGTAIHALNYILVGSPSDSAYADTLAMLYVQNGQYLQAELLASIQLNRGYTDMRMEIKAVAAKNINDLIVAIDSYGTLYEKTKNRLFGFEKLQLENGIKRLEEANNTANLLLKALPDKDSIKLQVTRLDNKTVQTVPFRAGILNIQGALLIKLDQLGKAQTALQAALLLAPEFEQAKYNLSIVKELYNKHNKNERKRK